VNDAEQRLRVRVESRVDGVHRCNDCLLACPITQSKSVTIGELNAAIFLPTIDHRQRGRFVTACTQCKQLRPACPSDLNRAEMVLFNKLKVENSVADFQLSLQARTNHVPFGDFSLDGLAEKLTHSSCFAGANAPAVAASDLKSDAAHARCRARTCARGRVSRAPVHRARRLRSSKPRAARKASAFTSWSLARAHSSARWACSPTPRSPSE